MSDKITKTTAVRNKAAARPRFVIVKMPETMSKPYPDNTFYLSKQISANRTVVIDLDGAQTLDQAVDHAKNLGCHVGHWVDAQNSLSIVPIVA